MADGIGQRHRTSDFVIPFGADEFVLPLQPLRGRNHIEHIADGWARLVGSYLAS